MEELENGTKMQFLRFLGDSVGERWILYAGNIKLDWV